MAELVPGIIVGFREGLEAFLIIAVIQEYRFLDLMKVSIWNNTQRKNQE